MPISLRNRVDARGYVKIWDVDDNCYIEKTSIDAQECLRQKDGRYLPVDPKGSQPNEKPPEFWLANAYEDYTLEEVMAMAEDAQVPAASGLDHEQLVMRLVDLQYTPPKELQH